MHKKILNSLSVFCGSSRGNEESYYDSAFQTGLFLAEMGIRLVYGGAKVGLMGAVADGALSKNGIVVGVIPEVLMDKEIAGFQIDNLRADLAKINIDESSQARNDEFIKGLKKDIYLEEALFIMRDMINLEKSFANLQPKILQPGN